MFFTTAVGQFQWNSFVVSGMYKHPAAMCTHSVAKLLPSKNNPPRNFGSRLQLLRSTGRRYITSMTPTDSSDSNHRLSGRLFGPGDEGSNWWDDKCLFHPVVVRDSSSSSWRMYYYGRDGAGWSSGVSPALLSTGRVGMAMSEDGVHWNRHRGPLPAGAILDPDEGEDGAFDAVHVGCSDVFFHDGQWWMFYFGGSTEEMTLKPGGKSVQGFRMRPGLVQSSDGLAFQRRRDSSSTGIVSKPLLDVGGPGEWDELFVAWPRVLPPSIHRPHWLMTYSSIENQTPAFSSIGLAISADGHQWTKAGKVLTRGQAGSWDEGGVGRRHVLVMEDPDIQNAQQYVMFYEGVNLQGVHGIGLAVSSDGIHWQKEADAAAIFSARVGEDAWDNGTVAAPHVVAMDDGSFRLYYVGSDQAKKASAMGLAVSQGRNFRSWRRFEA